MVSLFYKIVTYSSFEFSVVRAHVIEKIRTCCRGFQSQQCCVCVSAMTVKECSVCDKTALYKCPSCLAPYCCVQCCQTHKAACSTLAMVASNGASKSLESAPVSSTCTANGSDDWFGADCDTDSDASCRVPTGALQKLGQCARMRELLSNGHLRELINVADWCRDPETTMRQLMTEPIFSEFADQCLRIIGDRASVAPRDTAFDPL